MSPTTPPDPRRYAPESLTDRIVEHVDNPPRWLLAALVALVVFELALTVCAFALALAPGSVR